MSGTTANPVASPTFIYKAETQSLFILDGFIEFDKSIVPGHIFDMTTSAGVAFDRTKITGTSGAFEVSDTISRTGFTFTIGAGYPVAEGWDVYWRYRGIVLPKAGFSIPGQVDVDSYMQIVSVGITREFKH
jgi:hypothetical protein